MKSIDKLVQRVTRLDGWRNVLTGLSVKGQDKRMGAQIGPAHELSRGDLSNLFASDPMARRIAELPAKEQTRQWIRITSDDGPDVGKEVLQSLQVLEAQSAVCKAITWARLYGGSAMILGVDDGRAPSQPLNEAGIKSLKWLNVQDRYHIEVEKRYTDLGPKMGEPKLYKVRRPRKKNQAEEPPPIFVHESRVIRFDGVLTTADRLEENDGWCDSVFVGLRDTLADFWGGFNGASHLLTDFSQGVLKLQGLADLIGSGQDDTVVNRVQIMDLCRSLMRTVVIDAEEEFERKSTAVAGYGELLTLLMLLLSAVTGIPVTLLMGRSPAGENATGESDTRFFYDNIAADQDTVLRPKLERLLTILLRAKDGPTSGREPQNWSFEFNPLWQLSDLDQATVRNTQAQTDAVYIDTGVVAPQEIRESRFGGDVYSTETTLSLDDKELDELLDGESSEDESNVPPFGGTSDDDNLSSTEPRLNE